ncbi:hypothetical protein [Pseudomonas sp. 10-1B]|uniref:hypothetical protein n=1 Tax=Pseudomonas sp. 10-1B TaxID=1546029 RepID=UPI001364B139|nr:hypothetical protein [Pseudomonas sp. 10-1B]
MMIIRKAGIGERERFSFRAKWSALANRAVAPGCCHYDSDFCGANDTPMSI